MRHARDPCRALARVRRALLCAAQRALQFDKHRDHVDKELSGTRAVLHAWVSQRLTTTPFPRRGSVPQAPSGGTGTGVSRRDTYAAQAKVGQDSAPAPRIRAPLLDDGRACAVRECIQLELRHVSRARRQRRVACDVLVRLAQQLVRVHGMARGHIASVVSHVRQLHTACARLAGSPWRRRCEAAVRRAPAT